ncbi:TPA: DEAD/DEAH box helicase [Candidatus Micrarchaeota archaeon]|nr:DEAD/DEAH box helicase [Candidatus Micrarchaeota archaeon]
MELKFKEPISKALHELGFTKLTEVQAQAIPLAMQGEDLIVQSRTGTGKTAAFALPILEATWQKSQVQTLVLTPTRELALQVATDFKHLGKYTNARMLVAYGGTGIDRQLDMLRSGVQIVVGTPGRILDLLERRALDLSHIQFLVLDEADIMLAMGFSRDVEKIISYTNEKRQIMLFCVDLPDEIVSLTKRYLNYPNHVKLVSDDISAASVKQYFYEVPPGRKLGLLLHLFKQLQPKKTLIFCRTKRSVQQLARQLTHNGIPAEGLQGNLTQAQRTRIMLDFKSSHGTTVLVATDIAARGIHVEAISHVFNYELPYDINNYVHRVGRTGRMSASGEAIALCYPDEMGTLGQIERLIGKQLVEKPFPEGIEAPKSLPYLPRGEDRGSGGRPGGFRPRGGSGGPRRGGFSPGFSRRTPSDGDSRFGSRPRRPSSHGPRR